MEILKKITECKSIVDDIKKRGLTIGFVPTMGFLHEGHLSLIRKAKKECDRIFISIFVNPLQFGPGEDFKNYPRDMKRDISMAGNAGADYIFYPAAKEMYGQDFKTAVEVKELGDIMCGEYRPGHFSGVATVVLKFFNIVKPDRAYFGQKDYQQLVIIKRMVCDMNLDVKITGCPTVREKDGLALSSRNKYLSAGERKSAAVLFGCLTEAKDMIKKGEKDLEKIRKTIMTKLKKNRSVRKVDYFDFRDPGTLEHIKRVNKENRNILAAIAVRIGKTRLIDNMIIKV
ncbi:MAG: pantoate--beta-alanine ligase [Actinomycetota bacterium]|nr:pantoate--beta-alanine ligase [Actinomycetota bacterium]